MDRVHCPAHFYEANIAVQAVISYGWLANQGLMVNPRRHGLFYSDKTSVVFLPGVKKKRERYEKGIDR